MFTANIPLTLDQVYDRFNGVYQYNFSDLVANTAFMPVYTWPEIVFEQLHRTPNFHYYDCTCKQCRAIHFPCDDMACAYCDSVRQLLYNNSKLRITTTPELGMIVDFATWNDLPDDYTYDADDMVWKSCEGCGILYNGISVESDEGYHSYECKAEYSTIYCASCGENEVEYDGNYCSACEREERNSDLPYMMGEVLDIEDYGNTTEAWINPNGDLHYVPEWNIYNIGHQETAHELGFSSVSAMESAGYLHVSTYYNADLPFRNEPRKITDSQMNTAMLLCDAHGWSYPDFVNEWLDAHKTESECNNEEFTIAPMQNLSRSWLTMPRSERDKWYKLSGD